MITSKEKLFESTAAANVISRELAGGLLKSTRNITLKGLLDKATDKVVISSSLRNELFTQLQTKTETMAKARNSRSASNTGGRPRIPEPDNPDNLTGDALRRYKNRVWQRQSRHNRGLTAKP